LQKKDDYVLLMEPELSQPEAPEEKPSRHKAKGKKTGRKILFRILVFFFTLLIVFVFAVYSACYVLLNGPSETVRNALVLSAKQASATKWLPGLFLDEALVAQIEAGSKTITYDVLSMDEVTTPGGDDPTVDEWADAIDGIKLITMTKPTFKAYLLMVKDPSRVFVGVTNQIGVSGESIFDITERFQAVAAINGGEFPDGGGVGTGHYPIGITYSQGQKVNTPYGYTNRTFMGLTHDNRLIVSEGMTEARARELGIRDGCCFQRGNCLITNDGTNVTYHYSDGNVGAAQRTVIGQRKDGTILLLVTDGRTASSIGATHNDLIEIMRDYGAVAAGKLDGGSSAMMYYRNYFELYDYDLSRLDEYQRRGLVNSYKAFTAPRKIPTYFIVKGAN